MPRASNGPFQATGPWSSPSRAERSSPRGKPRLPDPVGSQNPVPKGCAPGPRVPAPPQRPRRRQRPRPPTDHVRAHRAQLPVSVAVPWPESRGSAPLEFRGGILPPRGRRISYLVDPASSHMLVSKIKPCMSKYRPKQGETANGSLNQLWFIGSYPFLLG